MECGCSTAVFWLLVEVVPWRSLSFTMGHSYSLAGLTGQRWFKMVALAYTAVGDEARVRSGTRLNLYELNKILHCIAVSQKLVISSSVCT